MSGSIRTTPSPADATAYAAVQTVRVAVPRIPRARGPSAWVSSVMPGVAADDPAEDEQVGCEPPRVTAGSGRTSSRARVACVAAA